MSKVKVYNLSGEVVSEHELNPAVFDVAVSEGLVHQAAVTQMANNRQTLAHTKDRSEVRGGGKKPWRQKGTGRARAGSSRSPIWKGGGVTFGPRSDRNYEKKMPDKMKKKALLMVLSDKVRHEALVVLDKLRIPEAKAKKGNEFIKLIEDKALQIKKDDQKKTAPKRSILILNENKDDETGRALKNLRGVENKRLENINIVDLLKNRNLILTLAGVKKLEKQYSKK
ncbi:MAG: 50S ribosomal protein L4 [bacterium]|nr:50S ribosomal protein L4 [bacterium]